MSAGPGHRMSALRNPIRPRRSKSSSTKIQRAIFCESVGNPAGNICDIEALAASRRPARNSAHCRQHCGDADPVASDRLRRRHCRALADQIHGRPRHYARRCDCRFRTVPVAGSRAPLSNVQRARSLLPWPDLHRALRSGGLHRPLPQRLSTHHRRRAGADLSFSPAARDRDGGTPHRAPCGECAPGRGIPARRSPRGMGQLRRLCRQRL